MDVIEKNKNCIDMVSAWTVQGITGIFVAQWLDMDSQLKFYTVLTSVIYLVSGLLHIFVWTAKYAAKFTHPEKKPCLSKFSCWAMVLRFLTLLATLALCVILFIIDKDRIVTILIIILIIGCPAPCMDSAFACFDPDYARVDEDDFKKAVEENLLSREEKWRQDEDINRIGTALQLREDLYAYSFISCFHRDYFALIGFLSTRQEGISENESAVKAAKSKVERERVFLQNADSNDQARKQFCEQSVKKAEDRLAMEEQKL